MAFYTTKLLRSFHRQKIRQKDGRRLYEIYSGIF